MQPTRSSARCTAETERTRIGDASGIKTQAKHLGRKFDFRRRPTAAAAIRTEKSFRRLAAARPLPRARWSAPGSDNGVAPLAAITGFREATHLPPAGSRRPGGDGRHRRILAAVGAVVEYAAERWPTKGGDIDGDLARAAHERQTKNRQVASESRLACRLTWKGWPGRQEAGQPPDLEAGGSRGSFFSCVMAQFADFLFFAALYLVARDERTPRRWELASVT